MWLSVIRKQSTKYRKNSYDISLFSHKKIIVSKYLAPKYSVCFSLFRASVEKNLSNSDTVGGSKIESQGG